MNCLAAPHRDARNNLILQPSDPLLSDETGSACFCQNFEKLSKIFLPKSWSLFLDHELHSYEWCHLCVTTA